MTGLNPLTDTILSLSCYITSSTLTLLDTAGYHCTISHTASQLASMNEWCIKTHGATGLTAAWLVLGEPIGWLKASGALLAVTSMLIAVLFTGRRTS